VTARRVSILSAVPAGIVASVAYSIVAEIFVVSLYGTPAVFTPFRQIAAVALGTSALAPEFDVGTAIITGTIVHLIVGIGYAIVFALIASMLGLSSRGPLVVGGMIYGALIYALNLYGIFPRFFPWFLENSPTLQVSLHSLIFGAVIGWWLSRGTSA
jgi:hypothetical protein